MERYPSHQLQYECYREWSTYLERFPWEWHCSLSIETGTDFFYALKLFKKWHMRLFTEERLRVGAYLLSVFKSGVLHFHVLMVGRNREGKTLYDCSRRKWELVWRFHARIRAVRNASGISDYVAKNMLGFKSSRTEIESFDRTLLRQVMRKQDDGFDNFDGITTDGR
jgi:hypothetical protein